MKLKSYIFFILAILFNYSCTKKENPEPPVTLQESYIEFKVNGIYFKHSSTDSKTYQIYGQSVENGKQLSFFCIADTNSVVGHIYTTGQRLLLFMPRSTDINNPKHSNPYPNIELTDNNGKLNGYFFGTIPGFGEPDMIITEGKVVNLPITYL